MDDDELENVLERFGGFVGIRFLNEDRFSSLERRLAEGDKIESSVLRQLMTEWLQQQPTENQFDTLNRVVGRRDEGADVANFESGLFPQDEERERVVPTGEEMVEFRHIGDRWNLFREGNRTEVFSIREPVQQLKQEGPRRFVVFINPDTGEELARREIQ